jgi:hypothetical protein
VGSGSEAGVAKALAAAAVGDEVAASAGAGRSTQAYGAATATTRERAIRRSLTAPYMLVGDDGLPQKQGASGRARGAAGGGHASWPAPSWAALRYFFSQTVGALQST